MNGAKIKILELFGGIGACSKALEMLEIDYEITDYIEIDKFAVLSFNTMHNTSFEPQDICKWDKDLKNIDLIMHGSPCQDFSLAGKLAGGDQNSGTRSSLMYETIRIVSKIKPKYIIWENVKNVISQRHRHNFDNYINSLDELGYANYYQVLNAKDYGIPQNRERIFVVSIRKDVNKTFEFPEKKILTLTLKDLLENEVDTKYYLSDEQFKKDYLINTLDVNSKVDFLKIKNATKKGYIEAYEGDSVNLQYPNSSTRRGRVGKQVSQTIQCNDMMGVVINKRFAN